MLVLRCTQKLLVRLKQTSNTPAVESTTRLGDWYGNILRLGRRQYLLFISERSRVPVVLPIGEAKRLTTVFPDAVCDVLASVGIAAVDIADERSRMSEIAFGRTRNRSLLGTMNDFALMAQHGHRNRDEPKSHEELVRFLSQTPIPPFDGASPIALTRAAFGLRSHVMGDIRSGRSGPNCAGALGRVKGPLAALAADAPLTRPTRSLKSAITGATLPSPVCRIRAGTATSSF